MVKRSVKLTLLIYTVYFIHSSGNSPAILCDTHEFPVAMCALSIDSNTFLSQTTQYIQLT